MSESSKEPNAEDAPEAPSATDPDDIELTPATIRWWRVAIGLLVAATVVAVIGLGSDGRAAGVWGAFTAGAERIGDEAIGVWDGTRRELQIQAAAEPEPQRSVEAPAGSYATAIVVIDGDRRAASVALAVANPEATAIVVVFPASLSAIVPGYGDFELGDTAVFEDAELTSLTLTNLLGTRVDATIELTEEQLAAAIGGPLTVDLPTDVVMSTGESGTILAERGEAQLQPSIVAAVLTAQGESGPLEWLERQGAVWGAVFESPAAADFVSAVAGLAGPGEDAATSLNAVVGAESLAVAGPPLTTIGIGSDEQLVLRGADADEFVASRFGHLLIREGERPRVEVLNGNGRPQTTRLVAETLVRRGFRVIRTDNADSFEYRDSRVIAQGRSNRLPGAEVVGLLGVGQLELEVRAPSGVVDVSIIVGEDIPIGEGS